MSQQSPYPAQQANPQQPQDEEQRTPYWRFAVWIAIGALIASAIVCVVWVLIGPDNDIIGKAFLTILLLAAFAGAAVLDASLSERRAQWYALLSMVGWVIILLAGAFKIWAPYEYGDAYRWDDPGLRLFQFVLIALIVRLAILHIWLYLRSYLRRVTPFLTAIVWITVVMVGALTLMLVIPLTFDALDLGDYYWRVVVAITILATVGTAIVPLVRALTNPRRRSDPVQNYAQNHAPVGYGPTQQAYTGYAQPGYAVPVWPTYVDGVTPLPVLPDGSPDVNAYYTGQPTYPAQPQAPQHQHQAEQQQIDPRLWAPPSTQAPPAPPAGQNLPPAPPAPPYSG